MSTEKTEYQGTFFNGANAEPEQVLIKVDQENGVLALNDGDETTWPLPDVREVRDQAGTDMLVLRSSNDDLGRLILNERDVRRHLPNVTKRPPVENKGRLLKWAIGAIASVALIVFVLVPTMADQLAEFIPPEGERALGEETLEQIRSALDESGLGVVDTCNDSSGILALSKMQKRLTDTLDLDQELTVLVLDHQMVNAFALPGGFIVLFRGLIDAAGTPEEVAAVFAHEIGHVVSRDPTRHALRSAGSIGVLGLLFGDFAGGAMVLFLTERLIDAQYSQAAEAAADEFAHRVLLDAGLPPSALADMFERFRELGGDAEGFVAHFLSHPQLGDRIAASRDATPAGLASNPVLSDSEWQALRNICN